MAPGHGRIRKLCVDAVAAAADDRRAAVPDGQRVARTFGLELDGGEALGVVFVYQCDDLSSGREQRSETSWPSGVAAPVIRTGLFDISFAGRLWCVSPCYLFAAPLIAAALWKTARRVQRSTHRSVSCVSSAVVSLQPCLQARRSQQKRQL